jgi:CubicO group peptidase (beta-lactamase class C family)
MDSTLRLPLTSVPGTVTAYTNIGYIIAGAVLERVTGKPWEELMRENLFQPLGLKSAGFGPPSKPGQVDQPWGHAFKAGKYEPNRADNPPALGPAGTVHCGLLDYLKFAELHTSLGSRGPQVLRPVSIAQLHEPPKGTDYAFGWSVRRPAWAQGPAFSHTGSNTNNHFLVWAAPKVDLCMAVATNSSTFEKDGNGKWFGQEKIEKVLYAVAAKIAGHFAG